MAVYTVENRKGGVGKTTTAANLAVGLTRLVKGPVLLVDLDPQGDAASALGVDAGDRCISRLLTEKGVRYKDLIVRADSVKKDGPERPDLYLLPATDRLKEAKEVLIARTSSQGEEKEIASKIAERFRTVVSGLFSSFRYVIIDCPPTLDTFQTAIHSIADGAIVPVLLEFHGVRGTSLHTRNLLADREEGAEIVLTAIVPTRVRPNLRLTRKMYSDLKKVYGDLLRPGIPDRVAVAEAPYFGGRTVLEYDPGNDASKAYTELVRFIIRGSGSGE